MEKPTDLLIMCNAWGKATRWEAENGYGGDRNEVTITQRLQEVFTSGLQDQIVTQATILDLRSQFICLVFCLLILLKSLICSVQVCETESWQSEERQVILLKMYSILSLRISPNSLLNDSLSKDFFNSSLNDSLSEDFFMNMWYLRMWLICLAMLQIRNMKTKSWDTYRTIMGY